MYNHKEVEKKWQDFWAENKTFKTYNDMDKKKYYVLDMFPYPSGAGLHVGHPEGYTANDIVARYKHAKGYNVLHPMGWDAFGLPAENYAIKTGTHPRITTDQNIQTFKRQTQSLGFSYDWDREIDTTDPDYFKWTQWIFLKLFEKGLAYEQNLPINYCPSCKTGLANEEVLKDFSCERCGNQVEKKKIRQWVLAITKYADRLLADVDDLDWPEGIKEMQRNWIGKSEGCEFELKKSDDDNKSISVYTTRVDTVFGMTYCVIAPDHPSVEDFILDDNRQACEDYIQKSNKQSDQDRTEVGKEKTGVFTGSYLINPYSGEEVPLWIADYVLGNYGTGAVMAVPAHDERDFEFAKKYGLEIRQSIAHESIIPEKEKAREGSETLTRKVVDMIIENTHGEYLIMTDGTEEAMLTHFVGGGIEEGDSELETVGKEIIEETGYTDFTIVGEIKQSYVHSFAFRHTKQKNQDTLGRCFHVKLNSDTQIASEIDEGKHTIQWVNKEDVKQLVDWDGHLYFWDLFINGERAFTDYGLLVNSGKFDRITSEEAKEIFTEIAEEKGFGSKKTNYKLRDWLFSRQRYWGEPIPLVHCNTCGIVGEKEENLPILLPDTENFEPSGDGTSPLTQIEDFVNCECPKCGGPGKRETNTMPQWGGSCWYYLRFMDPQNPDKLVDPEIEKYWGQVDSYVGGAEHAVLHLLYARFWHKFLYDIGVVSSSEPFHRLRNQGMILGMSYKNAKGKLIASDLVEEKNGKYFDSETGEGLEKVPAKMSKSLKNVINPDDIVEMYGADTLRLYEMYMADFKDSAPWDTSSIIGVKRFLDKVWKIFGENPRTASSDEEAMKVLHKTIKKVSEDIENYKFNTAIAQMMICINTGLPKSEEVIGEWKKIFLKLLHPFAPHMAEELWVGQSDKTESFDMIHLASGNLNKLERLRKITSLLDEKMQIDKMPDMVDVEEDGADSMENALQKLEPYKGKDNTYPILTCDSSIFFPNMDFDPTHVKRKSLEAMGLKEQDLEQSEVADAMVSFYKDLAKENGGKLDFYYIDAWALLLPNGEVKTYDYKRYYTLTDEEKGERDMYFPMRALYISKVTAKYAYETSDEDFHREFESQRDAIRKLLGIGEESIFFADWPEYDEDLVKDNVVTIGVQILGKLRGEIEIAVDESKDSVLEKAKSNKDIQKWIEGKEIVKEIYVPGRIVNLIIK